MSELQVIYPYTEEVVATFPLLSSGEVDGVVARARAAFEDWRHTDIGARQVLCRRFVDAFEHMADGVAEDISLQMGKPRHHARGEVNAMLERARQMIEIAAEVLADEHLPEKAGFVRYMRHEPLGVVLDIAAWNYPLLIAVNVVVPGILAGNSILLKHSSKTPKCGQAFVEAFRVAGAPDNLVQNIIADHRVTEQFIQHPGVDFVSFTGSVRGGQEVVKSASGRFINVGLELGGKDPAYVCEDADIAYAVAGTVDGAFFNAGQSCCAVERIYVARSIYDSFLEQFAALVREYRLGDPMNANTSIGPLAAKGAVSFLADQVADAVHQGGRLIVDPKEFDMPAHGWFAAPAVVADAPQSSRLMQEESFGPVITLRPVDSDEEAIAKMNDSPYGLTASIWTRDTERAMRVGPRVETGTFFMNRCDFLDPLLPWTGVKDTGRGATLSKYGLLQLSQLKSMHLRTETDA